MKAALLVAGALLVNLSLYLLMENMISRDRVRVLDLFDAQTIEFVRTPMEDQTRTKDRRRKPPPKPKEIKRPRSDLETVANRASELPTDMQSYAVSSLLGEGGGVALGERLVAGSGASMLTMMASDLTAITMVPPQYPMGALQRGDEGWVDLEFIVTEEGLVRDPVVLDSQPKRIFDRAATDAILRWRFRPLMQDGEPVIVRATIHIEFELPE